jgi:carboxyl-terminal processing protease
LEGVLEKTKKSKKRLMPKSILMIAAAILIFGSGYLSGQGKLDLNGAKFASRNQKLPENLDYKTVEDLYDTLRTNYDGELDQEKLLDGIKAGLAEAAGDPYTEFMNPKDAKQFDDDLNGTFSGIGAELGKEKESIVIISPIAGFPAEKAGLRSRDVIIEINGESTQGMTISDAVTKIRGEKGTEVKLKIVRDQSQALDFTIVRETITIPSVKSEKLEGNIGYLQITRFGEDTVKLAREAATQFKSDGVKGVILDVRGDPGGLLNASIDVASIWLPKGKTVLQEKRGDVVMKTFTATGNSILEGVSTVVLINGGSASASEIVAGALKDNNAARLIGEKSYGKGSVQQLERLAYGSVLKVTIARWYTPAGKNIDKEGISPDEEVKRTAEDFEASRDPQRDKALEFLKK